MTRIAYYDAESGSLKKDYKGIKPYRKAETNNEPGTIIQVTITNSDGQEEMELVWFTQKP